MLRISPFQDWKTIIPGNVPATPLNAFSAAIVAIMRMLSGETAAECGYGADIFEKGALGGEVKVHRVKREPGWKPGRRRSRNPPDRPEIISLGAAHQKPTFSFAILRFGKEPEI